jgi:hypothetical protein
MPRTKDFDDIAYEEWKKQRIAERAAFQQKNEAAEKVIDITKLDA